MAVPDFQSLMLPILQSFEVGKEYSLSETLDHIEAHFALSEEDKQEMVPSGVQRLIYNRTTWALTYLRYAVLVQRIKRGYYQITPRGLEFLRTNPKELDSKILEQYPEFCEARRPKSTGNVVASAPVAIVAEVINEKTPEENIDAFYDVITKNLSDDLLSYIMGNSPAYFEKLVIDLLVNMGYGGTRKEAGRAVGKSGDEGIDGVINEDRLGLDNIYVQAKRWEIGNTVGRPEIQKFVGALAGKQASKGIFITTSSFTSEARNYVQNLQQKVILIDGDELTHLMI